MKNQLLSGVAWGCLSALSLSVSTAAFAQEVETADENEGIQEIVVTAQKRSENVQDVPIAISAFGGDDLTERAVGNVAALASLSPNVNLDSGVSFTASTAVLAASIRGIGASDFALNIDPAVGVYVDGIYLARSVGANQDLLDVERIEILKGPQGTLFGRNTIGGAVSIVTRDPAKEFGVRGDLTVGRFNLFQARASVDLPLAENLYSSITVDVKSRDGYAKRIPFPGSLGANSPPYTVYPAAGYNSPSREGDEDNRTIRGKLKYDGGSLRLTLSGDYALTKGTAPTTLLQTTDGTAGGLFANLYNLCIGTSVADLTAAGLINMCNSSGTQLPSRYRNQTFPVNRLYTLAGVNADANPNNNLLPWDNRFITGDRDTSYATGNNFSRLENWGFTLTGEIDLSDNVMLKSITGYRKSDWQSGLDGDGSPVNMSTYSFDQRQKQFSQELQLVGTALDDKLNYVLGAYYFTESGFLADYVISGEGIYVIDGPNWLSTDAYAAFGQLDYRVSDLIGITLGARYTKESKDFEGGQQELSGLFYKLAGAPCSNLAGDIFPDALIGGVSCRVANNYPDPSNPLRIYPGGINKQSFNNFSPKVGVQLHPTDDVMVYGSWSKGYKTGGWTTRYSTPQTFVSSFDPEKATTYELGLKSTLLDRRLQINAAVFKTDYSAIQLNYQVGGSPTIDNVGDADIKGAELEITAQPTQGLTLNVAVGYTDAKYTALDPAVAVTSGFVPGLQAGAVVGSTLPKTPKWKVNFSPRYEFDLGNGGSITLLGDYTFISKQTNNVERTLVLNRPSVSIVNASIAYRAPDEKYTITVGGTNLTGKRYLSSGTAIPAFGAIIGNYNRPTEWYARLGFKF
ncbi:TonB-dependent receptor [Sphingorhabdus sp.]|uniref:TonB-dependent receptor n=1 Tax=Sphingorhabdus sp. TaxID=1902408 RepID=UPI002FDA1E59